MSTNKIKTLLKWGAVLPTAAFSYILAGVIANIFFTLQQLFLGANPESLWASINYYIVSSAISAAASVYFGSRMAPSHRKIVSMVLAALVVVISTVAVVLQVFYAEHLVWTILAATASAIAAGVVVYSFFEEGEDFFFE